MFTTSNMDHKHTESQYHGGSYYFHCGTEVKCRGVTKKGERCRRKASQDGYCYSHKPGFVQDIPDECAVCFETFSDEDTHLECGHWIHMACVVKSGKAECPICKTVLTRVSKKDRRDISKKKLEVDETIRQIDANMLDDFSLDPGTFTFEDEDDVYTLIDIMNSGFVGTFRITSADESLHQLFIMLLTQQSVSDYHSDVSTPTDMLCE